MGSKQLSKVATNKLNTRNFVLYLGDFKSIFIRN
jgi:hypothetical protein